MTTDAPATVTQHQFERFVACVAHAEAHFFALKADDYKAIPERIQRGIAHLQSALDYLRTGTFARIQAIRSAHHIDPIAYHEAPAPAAGVTTSSIDVHARFIAEVARAHSYLFTVPNPAEFVQLPGVVKRGHMALQQAMAQLRGE